MSSSQLFTYNPRFTARTYNVHSGLRVHLSGGDTPEAEERAEKLAKALKERRIQVHRVPLPPTHPSGANQYLWATEAILPADFIPPAPYTTAVNFIKLLELIRDGEIQAAAYKAAGIPVRNYPFYKFPMDSDTFLLAMVDNATPGDKADYYDNKWPFSAETALAGFYTVDEPQKSRYPLRGALPIEQNAPDIPEPTSLISASELEILEALIALDQLEEEEIAREERRPWCKACLSTGYSNVREDKQDMNVECDKCAMTGRLSFGEWDVQESEDESEDETEEGSGTGGEDE